MFLSKEAFELGARKIAAANNLSFETAREYLSYVGDTPELADDGRVVVRNESGTELARIILPIDES